MELSARDKRLEKLQEKYDKTREKLFAEETILKEVRLDKENAIKDFYKKIDAFHKAKQEFDLAKKTMKLTSRKFNYFASEIYYTRCNVEHANSRLKTAKNEKTMRERMELQKKEERLKRTECEKNNTLNLDLLVAKIPEELIKIIASYIPYRVRIQMIDHFHHPLYYLRTISSDGLKDLIYGLMQTKEVNCCRNPLLTNGERYWGLQTVYTKEESLTKIKYIMAHFKQRTPEFALRFMKYLAIIQKIACNYKYKKYGNIPFTLPKKQDVEFAWTPGAYTMKNICPTPAC